MADGEEVEMRFKKDKYPPEVSYVQIKDSEGTISLYSFDTKLFKKFDDAKTTAGTPMTKDEKLDFLARLLEKKETEGLVPIICTANGIDFNAVMAAKKNREIDAIMPPTMKQEDEAWTKRVNTMM
ncbi:MAG: hypothetical protein WCT31_04810 [Candidatus Micrarchaeia archaeon]|jgi:hypothetical protein